MAAPRTVLLFQTHLFDRGMARVFDRLQRACPPNVFPVVLMHAAPGTPKPLPLWQVPHHFVTTDEIRALPYPAKTGADGRPWSLWEGGHCDLVPLHFLLAHPGFDRAWVIEYDVRFTGPWSRLFQTFEWSEADLLACGLRRHAEHPSWECWESLRPPPGATLDPAHRIRAFMPIYRVSRRAIMAVDEAYRAGWGGHLEAAWPSFAAARGLRLEDIGGTGDFVRPENRDRFYTCSRADVPGDRMAPGTLVAFPPLFRPGSTPDRLYHPVKPFRLGAELRGCWQELRAWQGRRRRALLGWARRLPAEGG